MAFLARLDNVFLIGILGGVLLGAGVLDTKRRFLAFSIAAGLLPLLYASYNLLSFGHLVPVSGQVLSTAETSTVVFYVFAWGVIGIATGYVFANRLGWDTVSRLLDRRLFVVTLVLISVAHLFYYLYMHRTLRVWYLPIEVVVGSIVFALFFFVVSLHIPRVRLVTALFLLLLFGSYGVVGAETKLDPNQGELGTLHYVQAVYLSQHTDCSAVIGSGNAGILGYFSERQVVELNGLANSWSCVKAI